MQPSTLSVPEAGRLLGVSRGTAYQLARENRFPVSVLRIGKQLRVPRAPLLRLLGDEGAPSDEPERAPGEA